MARSIRYGTLQRLVRAYHLMCAREDLRRNGLVVPAGHLAVPALPAGELRPRSGCASTWPASTPEPYRTGRRSSQCGSTSS